jgi:hypothetical protein
VIAVQLPSNCPIAAETVAGFCAGGGGTLAGALFGAGKPVPSVPSAARTPALASPFLYVVVASAPRNAFAASAFCGSTPGITANG